MRLTRSMGALLGLALALSPPLQARQQDTAIRSSQMALGDERGDPQPVDLAELASSGARYNRVSVRVRARLDYFPPDTRYLLLVEGAARVLVIPIEGDARELSPLMGLEVEMVGLARELKPPQEDWCRRGHWSLCDEPRLPMLPDLTTDRRLTWPQVSITSFRVSDVSPSTGRKAEWPLVSLATLVTAEGKRDDQTIRVLGRFRGHNLFGDLPAGSRRSRADWVIKDDLHAAWVVDKPSKGKGWSLDGSDKSETERWVEVVGRPETVRGVTYLHAQKVNLATAPSSESPAASPPREALPPPPPVPPRIVFAMPLDGDEAIAPETRFVLQFSKDMVEATFAGRVQLRYTGPTQPGDRSFAGMRLDYDAGRRALTIDPGDVLRPGRQVELRLLPGIVDLDGLGLVPRSEGTGEMAERLAFRVVGR